MQKLRTLAVETHLSSTYRFLLTFYCNLMPNGGMPFIVYLLECSDKSLYVGHTENLDIRLAQHEVSEEGYVAKRKPFRLAGCTEFPSRSEALEAELRIKKWSRRKKLAYFSGDEEVFLFWSRKKKEQRRLLRQGRGPAEGC